jgi:hypothetical protein
MADEMTGLCVGPMPVRHFLDNFIPMTEETPAIEQVANTYFKEMIERDTEKQTYSKFVRLFLLIACAYTDKSSLNRSNWCRT